MSAIKGVDCIPTIRKQLPVDFRKTRFHDSARQSEAESTNEKNGGNNAPINVKPAGVGGGRA